MTPGESITPARDDAEWSPITSLKRARLSGSLAPDVICAVRLVGSRTSGGWKTEWMMRRYAAVTDQTLRAAAVAVSGPGIAERLPFLPAIKGS